VSFPELIANCLEPDVWPPEDKGVYVVTVRGWSGAPTRAAEVPYVGPTGQSRRFRTRIGDLVADMFGFWARRRRITPEASPSGSSADRTASDLWTCTSGGQRTSHASPATRLP
jgi:hypothetical protein